jgi:hypothetical protein
MPGGPSAGRAGSDAATARLAGLGELMSTGPVTPGALELQALRRAVAQLPAADRMTLGHWRRSALRARAATDQLAGTMDAAQAACRQGPSLDALEYARTVTTDDVGLDPRWPALAPGVPSGIRSVLSIPLAASGHPDAVLTAYSAAAGAFDDDTVIHAAVDVAGGVAVTLTAIAWRANAENLTTALASSRRIGAAIGVLVCRLHVAEDDAFEAMRVASQSLNRKLRDIAEDVVRTGALPEHDPGRAG